MSKSLQHKRRRLLRTEASPTEREASLNKSGVGLQLEKLEELLRKTIQPHCHNEEVRQKARHQFYGLAERELSRTEIHDIVTILLEALDSPNMSPTLVSYIHSTIGLLYLTKNDIELAIQSFTKALWVETTTMEHSSPNNNNNQVDVGLVLHRLALCQMRLGDRNGASSLLGRALKLYKECSLPNDHSYIQHAQEELDHTKKEKMPRRMAVVSAKTLLH